MLALLVVLFHLVAVVGYFIGAYNVGNRLIG